jgi:phosphatidylglycerol---prolipoprotein diacylglyceryl transferase
MHRVLISIPGSDFALYSFGAVLAVGVALSVALAAKRYGKLGQDPEVVWQLAWWFVLPGIIGARLFYVIQYRDQFHSLWDVLNITRGGMVFYGSAMGAFAGTILFVWKYRPPMWKLFDAIAPSLALGIAIGRIGCFLNGCCYGDYCTQGPSVRFPFGSDAGSHFFQIGSQSMLGFKTMTDSAGALRIVWVEPGTDAERAGLEAGDRIVGVNGKRDEAARELENELYLHLSRYKPNQPNIGKVELDVDRGAKTISVSVQPPPSLPVHPTQIYSTIGGLLLYWYLAAAFELRRRDGLLIAECFMLYPIGRFIIEYLRFDEEKLFDGLTISQNISFATFAVGFIAYLWLKSRPQEKTISNPEGVGYTRPG